MKIALLLFLSLFLVACEWAMPTATLDNLSIAPRIIYTDNTMSGRGNAVVFNDQVYFLIGYDATKDAIATYPDKGTYWHKLRLASESNPSVVVLEANPVTWPPPNTSLALTPDKKQLAMVYRIATGNFYGFRMPYSLWDGQKLSSSLVFPNENFGIYPRISYRADNSPIVTSFSAAGYFMLHHALTNGLWNAQQGTGFGEWMGDLQTVYANNTLYTGMLVATNTPFRLQVNALAADNVSRVLENTTTISSFCDIAYSNGAYQVLIVKDGKLLLGANNTYETVATEPGLGYHATLFYDGNTPVIAFQTVKRVRVLRRQEGEWRAVYNYDLALSPEKLAKPSLVLKNNQLYVVFNDDTRVYLAKL